MRFWTVSVTGIPLLLFVVYLKAVQGSDDDDDTCALSLSLCNTLDKRLKDLVIEIAHGHQELLAKLGSVQLHNQPPTVKFDGETISKEITRTLEDRFERFERKVVNEMRKDVEASASQVQSVSHRVSDLEGIVREIKSLVQVQQQKNEPVDEYCVQAGKIGLWNVAGKKTYISSSLETWFDAKTKCELSGMKLAVTSTLAQTEALWEAFQQSTKQDGFGIWVAASNIRQSDADAFFWSDGRPVAANLWGNNQPNNGLNACGNLYGPRLYDLPCTSRVYYACHLVKECK